MVDILRRFKLERVKASDRLLWLGDVKKFVSSLPENPFFDLVVTSPPYNINKEYEEKIPLDDYLQWQKEIITAISKRTKPNGSICWQVGNFVENGHIVPLDMEMHPIFKELGFKLRNRIIWHFGHGLHTKRRFSGRYEVVLWYTKGDDYTFNLDDVRIPSKYPGKRHFKGPNKGKLSGHPDGKNPEDVWNIPNVKSNHIEKTEHPCQFPVGLIERIVLALTNENDLVFDPFSGVGSAGVAAIAHKRRFWGCEISKKYTEIAAQRLKEAEFGEAKYRSHDQPIYDHTLSKLSVLPNERIKSDKETKKPTNGQLFADAV
ncbi:MAG: site-specific DNA-methyltransferase [Chitinophagaceae bacterium]